jgi:hypothetical protein
MGFSCRYYLLIAIALALRLNIAGQTYERTREVDKTFAIKSNTEIQIINKYGNIHVVSWEKDSVKFEIELLVKGNKQSKIQKNYDMVDFEFTQTDYYVVAQTIFDSSKGAFWDEVSDLASTIFSGSNRTQIDYKVYMPSTCPVKIENKFGNVYIGEQNARADIVISNGDLKAGKFLQDLHLEIDFGNVGIRSMKDADIIAGYAEFDVKKAGNLNIESKSSTFEFGDVAELQLDSRRDKFTIEEVESVKGKMSFSDLKIEYFTSQSVLTADYGSMDFQSVSEGFRVIRIDAKYTDIDLNFEENAAYLLDLQHTDKTDVSLPQAAAGFEKIPVKENETFIRTKGTIGEGSRLPVVEIKIESGHIFITNY